MKIAPEILKSISLRIAEIIVIGALIWGIGWGSEQIQGKRRELAVERLRLEASLKDSLQRGVLQSELDKREHDLQRIQQMLPNQNQIAEVITSIEESAQKYSIEVTVPAVQEPRQFDKNGKELPQRGPIKDIQMQVIGRGEASDTLMFFHELENMPYLVEVKSFKFGHQSTSVVPKGNSENVPNNLPPGVEEDEIDEVEVTFEFDGQLLLSISVEDFTDR